MEHARIAISYTRKFSPPTGGFFLAPAEFHMEAELHTHQTYNKEWYKSTVWHWPTVEVIKDKDRMTS